MERSLSTRPRRLRPAAWLWLSGVLLLAGCDAQLQGGNAPDHDQGTSMSGDSGPGGVRADGSAPLAGDQGPSTSGDGSTSPAPDGSGSTGPAPDSGGGTSPPGPGYYVSPTGSDSNPGTSSSSPFKTLGKAQSAMRSSSIKTVYLMGGTYSMGSTLSLNSSDAGQSWLGYTGQTPVLEGNNSSGPAISIGGDNITVRWLTIQNFAKIGIRASNVHNVVIDSNTIKNITSSGWGDSSILIGGTFANGKITHNLIQGSGYCGIELNAFSGDDISNLLIDGNAIFDTMLKVSDGGAIYIMDRGHSSSPKTVSNNVVGNYGNSSTVGRALYLDDMMSNVTVEKNIVYGSGQWSVQYHGGDHNVFRNNIFDVTQASQLGLYQDCPSQGSYGMNGNAFNCNVVYSSGKAPASLWQDSSGGQAPLSVSGNVYWAASGTMPTSGSFTDSSPVKADPHFVDPANANYGFQSGSPTACFQPIDASTVGPLPH